EGGDQREPRQALGRGLGRGDVSTGPGQVGSGVGDVDELQLGVEQHLGREAEVEGAVPVGDAAGQHPAHRESAAEELGVELDQPGADDPPQGVAPGDRLLGFSELPSEEVEERELVLEGVRQRPAGAAVGGTGKCVALLEQPALGGGVAAVAGRVAAGGRRVTVAVEEEGAVPALGDVHQVGGGADAARVGARLGPLWSRRGRLAAGDQPQRENDQRGQYPHGLVTTHGGSTATLRRVTAHASETISSNSSSQKSLMPSGMRRIRSGSRRSTNSASWLTTTSAPGQARSARAKASREGGSRLLVGSSRTSRLCRPAQIWARASFVFSPPERLPASWKAASPWRPNMPSSCRSTGSSASDASRMWSRTLRAGSRPSCSCA